MLATATRSSAADSIPLLRRFSSGCTRYVGIDVGIDRVNVSVLGSASDSPKSRTAKKSCGWISQSEFRLPVDPQAPIRPDWVDLVADCLADRLPRCVEGDRNNAVIALPTPWIHYQTTSQAELVASQNQCDAMFSTSIFQSGAHIARWPVVTGKSQYMIAAISEAAARRVAESIASVGYRVRNILPHGVALVHAASSLTSLAPSAVLLLETSGGLIAARDEYGCGLCRTLPPCRVQPSGHYYLDELEPWLQLIASEIKATSRYVSRLNGPVTAESPVLICGGAATIDGVDAALASMLGRPVATWRYAGRLRPSGQQPDSDPRRSDAANAVSLSLAFCGMQSPKATARARR
jgi:hypothetical protein